VKKKTKAEFGQISLNKPFHVETSVELKKTLRCCFKKFRNFKHSIENFTNPEEIERQKNFKCSATFDEEKHKPQTSLKRKTFQFEKNKIKLQN
jgi:hypothetical protein